MISFIELRAVLQVKRDKPKARQALLGLARAIEADHPALTFLQMRAFRSGIERSRAQSI